MNGVPRIVSIVEGDGELLAVPKLIERISLRMDPPVYVDSRRTVLTSRDRFPRLAAEREGKVRLAREDAGPDGALLVLLDSDGEPPCLHGAHPCLLGTDLTAEIQRLAPELPVAVVFAEREYEAWFLAASPSLAGYRGLPLDLEAPQSPDQEPRAKEWLSDRMPPGQRYDPARDQVGFTDRFDMQMARERSPSFDFCYREIERLIRAVCTT
jgi:hypothetical protein